MVLQIAPVKGKEVHFVASCVYSLIGPKLASAMGEGSDFGRRLTAMREKAGMSKYRLAHATGFSISQVRGLEENPDANPTLKTLQSLSRALSVPVAQLLGEEPPAPAVGTIEVEKQVVAAIRCAAVNVQAGPGAQWTTFPSRGPRHYFYRKSFLRRAVGLKRDAPDPDWSRFSTVLLDRNTQFSRSMMPTIQPGAMLLVDEGYDIEKVKADPRTICFVNMASEWQEKRLVAIKRVTIEDHICILESDNPEPEFRPVIRHLPKNPPWKELIFGVVLEWSTQAKEWMMHEDPNHDRPVGNANP